VANTDSWSRPEQGSREAVNGTLVPVGSPQARSLLRALNPHAELVPSLPSCYPISSGADDAVPFIARPLFKVYGGAGVPSCRWLGEVGAGVISRSGSMIG
jgi:hypothetical protein